MDPKLSSTYHDGEVPTGQELYETRHGSGLHHHLYPLVGVIGQIRQSPADVGEDLAVIVVEELHQGRKHLLHGLQGRGRVLVATQVGERPGHVEQVGGLSQRVRSYHGYFDRMTHRQTLDGLEDNGTVTLNICYGKQPEPIM